MKQKFFKVTALILMFSIQSAWALNIPAGSRDQENLNSALRNAAREGRLKDISRFLAEGAKVDGISDYGQTPLMQASLYGHLKAVKLLLAAGAEVNARDDKDNSALHFAGSNCNNRVVSMLLQSGADVNWKNNHGTTVLMNAAEQGCLKSVEILLRAPRIDISAKNDWYKTALDYAREGWTSMGADFAEIMGLLNPVSQSRPKIAVQGISVKAPVLP